MDSFGLNNILFLGSTFKIKYFNADNPICSANICFSVSLNAADFSDAAKKALASSVISLIKSSASTTVPSRLFILPSGKSTMP